MRKIFLLVFLSVGLQKSVKASHQNLNLIITKVVLGESSRHSLRNLYIHFQNTGQKPIHSYTAKLTLDGEFFLGKLYAKTVFGLTQAYPIEPGVEGVIEVIVPEGKWQHCQSIPTIIESIKTIFRYYLPSENNIISSSFPSYLRVRDTRYSSTCSHLE
ncbi:MAG: hypothetical protein CMP11_06695 [Zetaproteobacteria bacterium]|nr:hypothetical protein [Pseudobdellovibrionaceae bacterium]|tara:strand:- start:1694 stop:2167 length:474 start_codon:yes stop_codon:yes gene_type:complete